MQAPDQRAVLVFASKQNLGAPLGSLLALPHADLALLPGSERGGLLRGDELSRFLAGEETFKSTGLDPKRLWCWLVTSCDPEQALLLDCAGGGLCELCVTPFCAAFYILSGAKRVSSALRASSAASILLSSAILLFTPRNSVCPFLSCKYWVPSCVAM